MLVSFAKKYGQYGQTSYKGRIGQFSVVVNCCLIALLYASTCPPFVHMLPPPLLCGSFGRCLIRLFIVRQTHSITLSEESILDCVSTFAPCLSEEWGHNPPRLSRYCCCGSDSAVVTQEEPRSCLKFEHQGKTELLWRDGLSRYPVGMW